MEPEYSKLSESLVDFTPNLQTIKKSALHSIIMQLFFKLKGIIAMPIITYFLLPEELGIYNLIIITASLLTPIFSLNLTDGPAILLVQEKSHEKIKDIHSTVINSALIFYFIFSWLFFLAMSITDNYLNKFSLLIIFVIFANLIYKLFSYVLAVFQKTSILVKNTFIKDTVTVVLSIILIMVGFSYFGMLFALIMSNLVATHFIYSCIKRDLPYRLYLDMKMLIDLLKLALPLLPVFIFSWIIQSSDNYFIAYFMGEGAVGRYNIIYSLCSVILSLTLALNFFWFPVSAKLWVTDRVSYQKAFENIFSLAFFILLTGVLFFELNSENLVWIFARNKEYQSSYIIMGIIAIAFSMQVLITLLTAPLYSNRNINAIFLSYLAGGIFNCVLNLLLIPSIGIFGASISTALSYIAVVSMMIFLNYKVAEFKFIDKRLKFVLAIFIIFWALIFYIRENLGTKQILLTNIPLLLIVGSLFYFIGLTKEERKLILVTYKNFRNN